MVSSIDLARPSSVRTAIHEISRRGERKQVPALYLDDTLIVTSGRLVRVAEVFDEYWLEASSLPDPLRMIQRLVDLPGRPDLLTFSQRVSDPLPRFGFHMEWGNVAVLPVTSYETWLQRQISAASRRNVRASERKGVIVREARFDEEYVRGIMAIYDENPIRHGRRYWHYGKSFERVRSENGTYAERSTFLGAYWRDELVGYMKIVWDVDQGGIMQIVSKMQHFDKRPNNALLAYAVRLCSSRGVQRLLYEKFVYGSNQESSLTRFKRENGFVRVDLPRYYVPLTRRGRVWLRLGLHRDPRQRIPWWLKQRLVSMRSRLHGKGGPGIR